MGNILIGLGTVVDFILMAYLWIVIIGALLSWVNPDPYNPIVRFLYAATEPIFFWFRRRLPFLRTGGIDLTPILVIAVVYFLKWAVARNLIDAGIRMKGGF